MGVEVHQGLSDKAESIDQYLKQKNLSWKDVWYIGNDINNIEAIRKEKFSNCPSYAVKAIKEEVDLKLKNNRPVRSSFRTRYSSGGLNN